MKVSFLFLLLFLETVTGQLDMSVLLKSIKSLGWKRITLVAHEVEVPNMSIEKKLSTFNIASMWMQGITCWNASYPLALFVTEITTSTLEQLSANTACSEHYTLLLVPLGNFTWETAEKRLSMLRKHQVFFMLFNADSDKFLRVQTFRKTSSVIKQALSFDGSSVDQGLQFDLKQEPIWHMNLDWVPFVSLYNCNNALKNCQAKGILVDTFALLEKLYNFTFIHDREPNNNWGTELVDNFSVGVFGALTDGDNYDLTMGPWSYSIIRYAYLDSPNAILVSSNRMVANLGLTPIDITLFLRPFTPLAWAICVVVTILVLGSILLIDQFGKFWSVRIVTICGWIFFVLVNAFYGGALTMFFSVSSVIPFQSVEEGLKDHSGWNLFIVAANTFYFKMYRTQDGTIGGLRHLKDELEIVPDLKSALEKVVNDPGSFFVEDIWRFSYYMTTVPVAGSENVRTFGEYLEQKWHSLLPKNSPYTKMFRTGMEKLKQSGAIEQLKIKYFGSEVFKNLINNKQSLNGGHVALIFIVLSWTYLICLFLFLGEFLYKKL